MGTTTVYNIDFNLVSTVNSLDILENVKRAERRVFPKDEAMDFDLELGKRNTEMMAILGGSDSSKPDQGPPVAAYMLYARLHGITLLHKMCVVEGYRRQGIARKMLTMLKAKLESQGCERLQLWVDVARAPARRLYESVGFHDADWSRDYYGPGRTGVKMVHELTSVW